MRRSKSILLTTALLVSVQSSSALAQMPNSNPGIGNNGSTGITSPSGSKAPPHSEDVVEKEAGESDASAKKKAEAAKKAKDKGTPAETGNSGVKSNGSDAPN